jgi:hypothetical protein
MVTKIMKAIDETNPRMVKHNLLDGAHVYILQADPFKKNYVRDTLLAYGMHSGSKAVRDRETLFQVNPADKEQSLILTYYNLTGRIELSIVTGA